MKSIVSLDLIVIVYEMNLAFIRYFLAVAETASFTAAAEHCHVTQPTLSAGVARLEDEIGSRLFERGRRAVLAATDHRAATRDRWSVKDLGDMAFVLRAACEATEEATRRFAAEGVRPRVVLRSADEERCAAAVLAGLGVCLMPRSLLRPGMAGA